VEHSYQATAVENMNINIKTAVAKISNILIAAG